MDSQNADSNAEDLTVASERRGRSPLPDLIGSLVADRYRVLDLLGVGGMGQVYVVEHVAIRKKFALKVLNKTFVSNQEFVDRFLQEARAASAVAHRNVVEITDYGFTDTGVPFFVMEYLEGEELSAIIKREGSQPWKRVRGLMVQLLAALEAAHQQGVIHRDVKPHNCFLVDNPDDQDILKVLDFGIAKVVTDDVDYKTLTPMGTMLGTVQYMAPEQARSEIIDERADVYAAGVIAFELLTGKVPYRARGMMGVISKLLTQELPSIAETNADAHVPPRMEAVVRKALAKDRDHRYASAADFADALRRLGTKADPVAPISIASPRPRWLPVALVAGLLLVLCGGLVWMLRARMSEDAVAARGEGPRENQQHEAPPAAAFPLVEPAAPLPPKNPHATTPNSEPTATTGSEGGSTTNDKTRPTKPKRPNTGTSSPPTPKYEIMIDVRKRCELEVDGTGVQCKQGKLLRLSAGPHELRWRFPGTDQSAWLQRTLRVSAGDRRCLLLFSDDYQLSSKTCQGDGG